MFRTPAIPGPPLPQIGTVLGMYEGESLSLVCILKTIQFNKLQISIEIVLREFFSLLSNLHRNCALCGLGKPLSIMSPICPETPPTILAFFYM